MLRDAFLSTYIAPDQDTPAILPVMVEFEIEAVFKTYKPEPYGAELLLMVQFVAERLPKRT